MVNSMVMRAPCLRNAGTATTSPAPCRSSKPPKRELEYREVLAMTLNRAPFDAIVAGDKKTEYRENKAFWRKRLIGIKYEEVHFRNGYAAAVGSPNGRFTLHLTLRQPAAFS